MPRWWWARPADRPMPGLHLPAMAHEAGIRFTMDDVVAIMRRTPYIADLKPSGKYVALDVHNVGGIPVIIKALLDGGLLHGDCLTVTGKTLAENHKDVVFPTEQDVIYPVSQADLADRRRGRAEGQPRAGRGDREGRRPAQPAVRRAPRCASIPRRRPSRRSRPAPTRRATSSSSATRGRRAARACGRCCPRPARSTARAWAKRWR